MQELKLLRLSQIFVAYSATAFFKNKDISNNDTSF